MKMTEEAQVEIKTEGYNDYMRFWLIYDNPHTSGTHAADLWDDGWLAAKAEHPEHHKESPDCLMD